MIKAKGRSDKQKEEKEKIFFSLQINGTRRTVDMSEANKSGITCQGNKKHMLIIISMAAVSDADTKIVGSPGEVSNSNIYVPANEARPCADT